MWKSLGTEFKVGVFAIVALATLGYMFFVLSPDTFRNTEYNTYYTVLRNAAGIVAKTHVKTSGVSIGKVKSVALEGNETRILFEVDKAVKVPTGSRIEIRSVGLLGDVHLEIVRGEDQGKYIEDGGFISQSEGAADMQALMAMLGDIGKDVKKVTGTLANVLGSEKGEQSVQKIVDNVEGLTADLRATTTALKNVIGAREGDLNDIVSNVKNAVADLREFSGGLKEVLDPDNRERIDRILASFDETMVDVKGSAKNINLISEKVEKGEGTIGRLVNDDQALVELEGAIKDIRRVLAPATKLQVEVDYHNEFRRDESSQHFFNVLLRTRPDRYYLIGLTDTTYDNVETRTSTEADPGDPEDDEGPSVTTTERIRTEKALRFNLQMAKRWYFVALRFGLFETTGGIATDMYFLRDKVRFTVEAFDWDTQDKTIRRNAHLKTYASVLFYNHLYAMAGVDDPTRTDPETGKAKKDLNYFFGAGLSFTDEDLKAVLGTAALVSQ
jgi:phospholipid/cholesterol/gamma-HCH transport system substrate-binding protein